MKTRGGLPISNIEDSSHQRKNVLPDLRNREGGRSVEYIN